MNKYVKCGAFALFAVVGYSSAENFFLPEKQERRRPVHQVKQSIGELMGGLLEQKSEIIKVKAEIQQALSAHLRAYIHGDKTSFFARGSSKDLQQLEKKLTLEKQRCEKELRESKVFLSYLRTPIVP